VSIWPQDQAQLALDLLPLGNKHAIDRAEWRDNTRRSVNRSRKILMMRVRRMARLYFLYPEYSPQREMASMLLADVASRVI